MTWHVRTALGVNVSVSACLSSSVALQAPIQLHVSNQSAETLITDSCFLLFSAALALRLFSCLHLFTDADFGSSGQINKKKILQVGIYWSPSHRTLSSLWFLSAYSAVMGTANMCLVASGRFSSWHYFSPPLCHVSWHIGDWGFPPSPVCPSSYQFAHSNLMEVVLPSAELPEPSSGVFQYQPFVWLFW